MQSTVTKSTKRVETTVLKNASMMKGDSYITLYLKQLQSNPLRTKMITSGTLHGLQELIASIIAKDRPKNKTYFTPRVPQMALYGSIISAPLGHILVTLLQKAFAGRTSTKAKVLQIIVSNLIVSPIQNLVYLSCMAFIAGARTSHQVRATVKAGFMPVMKVSWCTSPLALMFAQRFLPPHVWVPFFNLISFVIGTYINTMTKKKRIVAIQQKKKKYGGCDLKGEKEDSYSSRKDHKK
ncbi:v-SNARE/peroxisomal membrane protein A fusion protein [Terfezia boudieri ATCC MYA-4762]|uniref:V-SNARE/peroxisomal membrane protein A fusion protein n=1 Tax=Terfezia boudieri ATCC MYA-4762 TaxID=1051890 RepID=A0A3N4M3V5_9PEZI|nr:v-SNARE/peroxisomal membrane protein A fusion protein [Terfezia boudieri ATCC MYA-4762]